ncbi:hypothetical protein ACFLW2_03320 [Chloroflexota bacterium]
MTGLFRGIIRRDLPLDKAIALAAILLYGLPGMMVSVARGQYDINFYLVIIIPCLVYLVFRSKLQADAAWKVHHADSIRTVSHIIFIACVTLSVYIAANNLCKPSYYFILVLMAAAAIILDVLCLDEKKGHQHFIALAKITVLSLSLYAGVYFIFSGVYGGDTWQHNFLTSSISEMGYVPAFSGLGGDYYYYFPCFHILAGETEILTGASTYNSIFLSVGIAYSIIMPIFVFLIGKRLSGVKTGIVAALIVSLADWVILRGIEITPNSMGFLLFIMILYFILCKRMSSAYMILLLLLSATLILTHTISSFIALIVFVLMATGASLYGRLLGKGSVKAGIFLSWTFVTLFIVFMMMRWIQSMPSSNVSFLGDQLRWFIDSFKSQGGIVSTPLDSSGLDYFTRLYSSAGYLLLVIFGILGSLILLHARNRSTHGLAAVAAAAALFFMIYGFQVFNVTTIVLERWYPFLYALLAVLAVHGIFNLSKLFRNQAVKAGALVILPIIILFLMITNANSNSDSPLFFNGSVRIGYTESEIDSVNTLWEIGAGTPVTDIRYAISVPFLVGEDNYNQMLKRDNRVFISRNYYLKHPEWNERYRDKISQGNYAAEGLPYVVLSDYAEELGVDQVPRIYDNGNVSAYLLAE